MLFNRNADAEQQFAGARFRRVAVHFAIFDFGRPLCSHLLRSSQRGRRYDRAPASLPQLAVAHDDRIQHGERFKGELILTQLPMRSFGSRNVAQRRFEIAAEDLHKVDLPLPLAPIRPTVAAAKFNGDIFEQRLTAKLHGNVAGY